MDLEPRPEYKRAAKVIARMAIEFGNPVDAQCKEDLSLLMTTMEWTDRFLDTEGDPTSRSRIAERVLAILGEVRPRQEECLPAKLSEKLLDLRERLDVLGCRESFSASIKRIFELGKIIRSTESADEYVGSIIEEGKEAGQLLVFMTQQQVGEKFRKFLIAGGEAGNLFDEVLDAQTDYKEGERTLAPTIQFYAKTLRALIPRAVALVQMYPRKAHAFQRVFNHLRYMIRYRAKPY
jgi:hypothetical protein